MNKLNRVSSQDSRSNRTYPFLTAMDISMDVALRLGLIGCCLALSSLLLATHGQSITWFLSLFAENVVRVLWG